MFIDATARWLRLSNPVEHIAGLIPVGDTLFSGFNNLLGTISPLKIQRRVKHPVSKTQHRFYETVSGDYLRVTDNKGKKHDVLT
ncbi:hypothetical protein O5853_29200, partial [Escherichia coli]|nr:hypothetical protein [Escherichia coli]